MIGYQMVGSSDLAKAKAFYDELLGLIGGQSVFTTPRGGPVYRFAEGPMFIVTEPYDEQDSTVGNGSMTAFNVGSPEKVKELHAKALELGGTCEGEPGPRGEMGHFSYFRDLDGNKLCAFVMNG